MTTFSFFVSSKKSVLIEKNRFYNHQFVKQEGKFYIYARPQISAITENNKLNKEYWAFMHSIVNEVEVSIYFLLKELINKESENDFSIAKYSNEKGDIESKKIREITKETLLSYNTLYRCSFDNDEI